MAQARSPSCEVGGGDGTAVFAVLHVNEDTRDDQVKSEADGADQRINLDVDCSGGVANPVVYASGGQNGGYVELDDTLDEIDGLLDDTLTNEADSEALDDDLEDDLDATLTNVEPDADMNDALITKTDENMDDPDTCNVEDTQSLERYSVLARTVSIVGYIFTKMKSGIVHVFLMVQSFTRGTIGKILK